MGCCTLRIKKKISDQIIHDFKGTIKIEHCKKPDGREYIEVRNYDKESGVKFNTWENRLWMRYYYSGLAVVKGGVRPE